MQNEIISVNVFKTNAAEEERKNLFLQAMVKTIAKSEENLKIIKLNEKPVFNAGQEYR